VQDFVQNFNIEPRTLAVPICIQIAAFMYMLGVGGNVIDRVGEGRPRGVEGLLSSYHLTDAILFLSFL
jgi:hypothetical protein